MTLSVNESAAESALTSEFSKARLKEYRLIATHASNEVKDLNLELPNYSYFYGACRHLVKFIDATSTYLTRVCETNVSLSMKILWGLPDDQSVALHNLIRSTRTRVIREAYAPKNNFSYLDNTAFHDLLVGWPEKTYFASNNLLVEEARGQYRNGNLSWSAFYDTTLVVPIPPAGNNAKYPIGFLCADAISGNLDNTLAVGILEFASNHLYDALMLMYKHQLQAKERANSAAGKAKRHTAFGWRLLDGRLQNVNLDEQLHFQRYLQKIDEIYTTAPLFNREAAAASLLDSGANEALFNQEKAVMDELPSEEEIVVGEAIGTVTTKRWLKLKDKPALTGEEEVEILRKMSRYDDDARLILEKRNIK